MRRSPRRTAWALAAAVLSAAPALSRAQSSTDRPPQTNTTQAQPQSQPQSRPPSQPQPESQRQPPNAPAPPATAPAKPNGGQKPVATLARPRRPFRTSIDDYVEQVFRSHEDPCTKATREGVPCFPVSIEQEGPRFSVAEALRRYRPEGGPTSGVPTNAEIREQMSGAPKSASGGVSIDPVCTAKSLIRQITGGTNTFYLYRTWSGGEERPLLTDHKLDPNTYARLPDFRYEFMGEFKGECDAVAAWRAALRNAAAPANDNAGSRGRSAPADGTPPR